jgi:hypothetical protein
MQAVASTNETTKAKAPKAAKAVKGNPQMSPKPRLAKNIKVPRSVKTMAALFHPTDRHAEKAVIRSLAAEINAIEVRAKTRFKDKKED